MDNLKSFIQPIIIITITVITLSPYIILIGLSFIQNKIIN